MELWQLDSTATASKTTLLLLHLDTERKLNVSILKARSYGKADRAPI